MRIVIDTNVLVSGIFFGGKPRMVLESAMRGRHDIFASRAIVAEYRKTVEALLKRGQGSFDIASLDLFIRRIEIIEPTKHISVCRDPDDDKFIECAVSAKAAVIVSGDKDLLDLGTFEGIAIQNASDFLELAGESNTQ